MPFVLVLLIAAVIVYFLFRWWGRQGTVAELGVHRTERKLAFLSNGQLFHREPGAEPAQLESPFVKEQLERRERSNQKQGWKEGTAWNIAAGGGRRGFEQTDAPPSMTSAAFEPSGSLLYALKDGTIGGLFRREAESGRELRLLLKPRCTFRTWPSRPMARASPRLRTTRAVRRTSSSSTAKAMACVK
jgi:hypothetical protein